MENYELIGGIVVAVAVLGYAIAKVTKTKKDDQVAGAILVIARKIFRK